MSTGIDAAAPKRGGRNSLHPGMRAGIDRHLSERRNLIASIFIAMLMGIAYAEMFGPVRDAVRANGLKVDTLLMGFTFFFTSMRFFIGNQMHLMSEGVLKLRGDLWLYDFLVITLQSLLLCFLGGLTSVAANQVATVDFIDLAIALYTIDVMWILTQWALGSIVHALRREMIPWAWAVVNSVLVVALVGIKFLFANPFNAPGLVALFALSALAFLVDIVLIDHYDLIL